MDFEGITIERINHDCFMIKGSKVIYVDPFQVPSDAPKADLVLITHEHYDHCSPSDVKKIADQNLIILTVADCQSKLSGLEVKNITLVEPGNKLELLGLRIEVVPAYNTNKPFHQKENRWVGFVIEMDGKRIYHAGDTDTIPEMSQLKNIDVALLPVSGVYVMNAQEAAEACRKINPRLAIPMHYGAIVGAQSDADSFKQRAPCRVEII